MASPLKKVFALLPFGQAAPEGLPLIAPDKLPELTPDEIKAGWTPETLARYRQERERAAYKAIFEKPKPKQAKAANEYSPHRW